jgi:hypothetical protein
MALESERYRGGQRGIALEQGDIGADDPVAQTGL